MTPAEIELTIAGVTVFLSVTSTAFICGMFMGGMKSELRMISDRLAKLEGVFTLVPRGMDRYTGEHE